MGVVRSVNSLRSSRTWDEEEEMANKYEDAYSELDEVLSGLSGSEGLTDDEFRHKVDKIT
jgi:hypothetical protein